MACERHGYTNGVFCPACDQEAIERNEKRKTFKVSEGPTAGGLYSLEHNYFGYHGEKTGRRTLAQGTQAQCHAFADELEAALDRFTKSGGFVL